MEPWDDCICYGDYVPPEYNYKPPEEDNIQEIKYVYQVEE